MMAVIWGREGSGRRPFVAQQRWCASVQVASSSHISNVLARLICCSGDRSADRKGDVVREHRRDRVADLRELTAEPSEPPHPLGNVWIADASSRLNSPEPLRYALSGRAAIAEMSVVVDHPAGDTRVQLVLVDDRSLVPAHRGGERWSRRIKIQRAPLSIEKHSGERRSSQDRPARRRDLGLAECVVASFANSRQSLESFPNDWRGVRRCRQWLDGIPVADTD